jgi:hypothetical protein
MIPSKVIENMDNRYAKKMRECDTGDIEADHSAMDHTMVGILLELGFEKTVKEFLSTEKWYA